MREYKVYILHDNGHFRSALDLECEDDEDAIRLALAQATAPMEIWQGSRFVTKIDAEPSVRGRGPSASFAPSPAT